MNIVGKEVATFIKNVDKNWKNTGCINELSERTRYKDRYQYFDSMLEAEQKPERIPSNEKAEKL